MRGCQHCMQVGAGGGGQLWVLLGAWDLLLPLDRAFVPCHVVWVPLLPDPCFK